MFRRSTTMVLAVLCATASSVFAQRAAAPASEAATAGPIGLPKPPLFFREEWTGVHPPRGCQNLHDQLCEPALTPEFGSNPSLEVKLHGGGKPRVEGGEVLGAILVQGGHLFTGVTDQPWAVALRDKNNYVDLSGLGKIRWETRASGLHVIHPIVKLADGTWLLGEHADGAQRDLHASEFTVSDERWIKLDIDKVVTIGAREPEPVDAAKARKIELANAHGEWLDSGQVDLTKVDEVGFADLMPGSGHGYGGYMAIGTVEVYGKPVPRKGTP